MERILKAPEVTPLTLLTQSPLKNLSNRLYGLMRNGRVTAKRRTNNIYNKLVGVFLQVNNSSVPTNQT